jgi:hypothetical protein
MSGESPNRRQALAFKEVTRFGLDLVGLGEFQLQLEAGERGGITEIRKHCTVGFSGSITPASSRRACLRRSQPRFLPLSYKILKRSTDPLGDRMQMTAMQ